MTRTSGFFCKLLLNGASHDTKIGCIPLVWAGAKKHKFSFLLCAGPLIINLMLFRQAKLIKFRGVAVVTLVAKKSREDRRKAFFQNFENFLNYL